MENNDKGLAALKAARETLLNAYKSGKKINPENLMEEVKKAMNKAKKGED